MLVLLLVTKAGAAAGLAGASATGADADFFVGGKKYLLEVKKDADAQMGGTSVRYKEGSFEMVNEEQKTKRPIVTLGATKAVEIPMIFTTKNKIPENFADN